MVHAFPGEPEQNAQCLFTEFEGVHGVQVRACMLTTGSAQAGPIAPAEGEEPGQPAPHLLVVVEVEVLAYVRGAAVVLPARVQRIVEGVLGAPCPLERTRGSVIDFLVEQRVISGAAGGGGYGGATSGRGAQMVQFGACLSRTGAVAWL